MYLHTCSLNIVQCYIQAIFIIPKGFENKYDIAIQELYIYIYIYIDTQVIQFILPKALYVSSICGFYKHSWNMYSISKACIILVRDRNVESSSGKKKVPKTEGDTNEPDMFCWYVSNIYIYIYMREYIQVKCFICMSVIHRYIYVCDNMYICVSQRCICM